MCLLCFMCERVWDTQATLSKRRLRVSLCIRSSHHYAPGRQARKIQLMSDCVKVSLSWSFYKHFQLEHNWWQKRTGKVSEAQGSTPPSMLMEICQDPITILSTAHNVSVTIQNKDDNNAAWLYSVLKVNVGAVSSVAA